MCIFCDIIEGKIPSYKIYEDEKTYAFLDISCDVIGHTLVIPKKHFDSLIDISAEDLCSVMNTVQKISHHYTNDCSFDGVNLINCCGKEAEQSVFHMHMHILPRKSGDNIKVYPTLAKLDLNLESICNELKMD